MLRMIKKLIFLFSLRDNLNLYWQPLPITLYFNMISLKTLFCVLYKSENLKKKILCSKELYKRTGYTHTTYNFMKTIGNEATTERFTFHIIIFFIPSASITIT